MTETVKNNENAEQSTGWEDLDDYQKVDVKEYVESGLDDGSLEVFEAEKHARIGAVKGEAGQEVISWSEDENGNPIQEKVATVAADENGETGWIVTKTDEKGNPIVDKNGHTNQWIIDDETFHKKYEADPENPEVFKPVGGPQKFVKTRENLTISQWGEEMKMPRGSFINITNPEDMYAINPRDFEDTYTEIERINHEQAIQDNLSSEIQDMIKQAEENGDTSVSFLKQYVLEHDYPVPHKSNMSYSTLTGKSPDYSKDDLDVDISQKTEIENFAPAWLKELNSNNPDSEQDIASDIDKSMLNIKKQLEKEGYSVGYDEKIGITSVSWNNERSKRLSALEDKLKQIFGRR